MSLGLELERGFLLSTNDLAAPASARRRLNPVILYSVLVVLCPLLAVPLCILLGKSDFFLHHGASVWVQSNDAVFAIHDRPCDVLVFGDSTAMTGIDPDLVSRNTGLRTCNISVTNAVLAVTGNMTLDTYLRHNPAPRVLLIQLSPDDFQRQNRVWQHTMYAEGMLELLRHGSPDQGRRLLLTHPREALAFAGYAAGYSAYFVLRSAWYHLTHIRPRQDQVQVRNGFFTPPAAPRSSCEAAEPMSEQSSAFAHQLAAEFQTTYRRTTPVVLVDVAPIPSCDRNLALYARQLQGVTNNNLQSLPIQLFNDQRHYTAYGSRVVSSLISQQVHQVDSQTSVFADRRLAAPFQVSLEQPRIPH